MALFLSFHSLSSLFSSSLSPRAWPNPEAQRHCSISVTFDGPGLKQISIPLVDFKRCLNNDASQGRVNEACSGLATSDFKINLISSRDIISAPPSCFCSFARILSVPLFHFSTSLFAAFLPSVFQVSEFFLVSLSQLFSSFFPLVPSLSPFTPAP